MASGQRSTAPLGPRGKDPPGVQSPDGGRHTRPRAPGEGDAGGGRRPAEGGSCHLGRSQRRGPPGGPRCDSAPRWAIGQARYDRIGLRRRSAAGGGGGMRRSVHAHDRSEPPSKRALPPVPPPHQTMLRPPEAQAAPEEKATASTPPAVARGGPFHRHLAALFLPEGRWGGRGCRLGEVSSVGPTPSSYITPGHLWVPFSQAQGGW